MIEALPAIGDQDSPLTAGPQGTFDVLEFDRSHCVFWRKRKVACYRSKGIAQGVFQGMRRGASGVTYKGK